MWGEHNRSNAALAFRTALELGVSEAEAKTALANFKGTARRMELVGESNGAVIYDDYAHHPSEIKATLKAMREKYPAKKIFGPYTSKSQMETALKIVRKIFPFHSRKQKTEKGCLDFQLGRCPGPYAGAISKKDYRKNS